MTPSNPLPAADAAMLIAAWESATVQNLDQLLSGDASDALWEAMLALRDTGDQAAFAKRVTEIVAGCSSRVQQLARQAIEQFAAIPLSSSRSADVSAKE